jgi:hypothetical protein
VRCIWVVGFAACVHSSRPAAELPENRAPIAASAPTCRIIHGRVYDATTRKALAGVTLLTDHVSVLSDDDGAYEIDMQGDRILNVYYGDLQLAKPIADVSCRGRVDLIVRTSIRWFPEPSGIYIWIQ